jgi:glutathione S-transferase
VLHWSLIAGKEAPSVVEVMKDTTRFCAQTVGHAVTGKTWILGVEFSAADIMLGYTLRLYGLLMGEALPDNAESYWARLTERDAFETGKATDMNTGK